MSLSGERRHQSDKLEVFVYTSDGKRSEDFICFGCISLSELAQAYPVSGSAPLYSKDQQEFISEIRLHELVGECMMGLKGSASLMSSEISFVEFIFLSTVLSYSSFINRRISVDFAVSNWLVQRIQIQSSV